MERLLARSTPLGYVHSRRATRLVAVREYLQAHPGEPVETATLAAMSGLTECHLIRAFHLEFGLPPHAYHLRLRLAVAAELLSHGLSVSTVGLRAGRVNGWLAFGRLRLNSTQAHWLKRCPAS